MNDLKLSKACFAVGMQKLEAAFRVSTLSSAGLQVYADRLGNIKDSDFVEAVDWMLDNSRTFPAIADFKAYFARKKTPVWL